MIGQKIRIYPTEEQERFLEELCGFYRHAYNMMLAHKKVNFNLSFREIRDWYKLNKEPWANQYSNMIIESASEDLKDAFQRFFAKQNRYPSFKTKRNGLRFSINRKSESVCRFKDGCIFLNRNNHIRVSEDLKYAHPMSFTFRKDAGQRFISVNFKDNVPALPKTSVHCGIDVGLKTEITIYDSNNKCSKLNLNVDKLARLEKRRKHYQKLLSKKQRDSKSYKKVQKKLQTSYRKQNNYVEDFYKKSSHDIVKNYDIISIEDLNIQGMMKNRKVSHSFQMKALRKFLTILQAKAKLVGKTIYIVDRFFSSSQICSVCGDKNKSVKNLALRDWTCPNCGTHHDRDENAARNILQEAMKHIASTTI